MLILIKTVQNYFGGKAGVGELMKPFSNEENYKAMKWELHYLSIYGKRIISYLKMAESQFPMIHKIYNMFIYLHGMLNVTAHEDWIQNLYSEGITNSTTTTSKF